MKIRWKRFNDESDSHSITPCKAGFNNISPNSLLGVSTRVGSMACNDCFFHKRHNTKKQYVICSYPHQKGINYE